jgi:hypothetical protein
VTHAEQAVRVAGALDLQQSLDAGVPAHDVPRLERLVSTFVLGFAASEVGGRFGTGLGPPVRRGLALADALPALARLTRWLDRPVDWDAEFEADVADLVRLIETTAAGRP